MLVTPVVTFLSLALNLGTLLFLHGSDPNFVTTKQNLQRSIQTIESAATETWSAIAVHYNDILSPPPTSSTSSFSLFDRAEWVYRSCAVRILRSLDGPVSHSPCTPSSSSVSHSPSPSPSFVSSSSLPSASASTSISVPSTTELTLYIPLPPTCPIFSAPFVVDHVERPWETTGFVKMNFPYFWSLVLCILVSSATFVWSKVHHSADTSGVVTEPTYETHEIDSVVGSLRIDSDSTPSSNPEFSANSKSQVFATTADTSFPRPLPIVVTTSGGRVLFNAEITLPLHQIISASSSSIEFSVDVVAFRNMSFAFGNDSADSEKPTFIFNSGESNTELGTSSATSSIHTSDYEQTTGILPKATEDLQHASDSTVAETAPEPCIEWSAENADMDIGEPPVYMLTDIGVEYDDGWQVSIDGRHGGPHNGNRPRSDSRQVHETPSGLIQSAFDTKDWSRKGGMDVPGSIDPSAHTGLRPIRDLVPAGSGPTARVDPPPAGGEYPAGRDHTATSPPSNDGDGIMPSPLNRSDGIPDCCLTSGSTLGGGVSSTGADGVVGAAEAVGECSVSTVSPHQPLSPSTSPSPTTAPPLSPSLPSLLSVASSHTPVFVPGPIRHFIAAANGDYSGQPRRVIVDNIDSSTVAVTDPTSPFSCRLLEDALQDLEIEATSVQCFDGRVVGGVARYGVSYAILDFPTHMDALIAVRQLGSYDPEGRWLAEFSDPKDRTFGGRMAGGLPPVKRSVVDLQVLRHLAAQLDLCEN